MTLLDARGRPIDKSQYRKSASAIVEPRVGDKFGQWSGREGVLLSLPGGAVLQFDLSRLTLADYRAMRQHYQLGSSLNVLTFIMHGMDWYIESENKEMASVIEGNIREMWTPLIRAISQGFWAGFGPNAVNYEFRDGYNLISNIKDLVPEECRVEWKKIMGWAPDGKVKPSLYKYNGLKQTGFWIPPENCVHPDTRILCADMVWRRAGDLQVGQKIVAFDEDDAHLPGGKGGRCYRTAEIQVNNAGRKPCVEISTDLGDPILASTDHPFLVRRRAVLAGRQRDPATGRMITTSDGIYSDRWIWKNAGDLVPGDEVGFFGQPWEHESSEEIGWLAGIFDGEGSLSVNPVCLQISQNSGVVLDKIKTLLAENKFEFTATPNTRDRCVQVTVLGGRREIIRFLSLVQPVRFMDRDLSFLWDGVALKINKSVSLATVTYVNSMGEQPIASIQTSCGTFITEGYLTHNTLWYPCLMENGDYYGRKLLKAAFPSWFFSNLMHLFANRYYERFGEPLPIGRGRFESDVDMGGGKVMSGKAAMEQIVQSIRSRATVVLPSDRDPQTKEYDFDIEYLESQMRGADFERYMSRLDEEMSLAVFTPVLLFRTADVGSYNLGVQHLRIFQQMLNALSGDIQFYLQNYLVDRLKVLNFPGSENVSCKWVFRRQGNADTEMFKEVLVELIRQARGMPDLEELGRITGVKLDKIEELTAPAPDPTTDPQGDPTPKPTVKAGRHVLEEAATRVAREVGSGKVQTALGYRNRFIDALTRDGVAIQDATAFTDKLYAKINGVITQAAPVVDSGEEMKGILEKAFDLEMVS